MENPVEILPWHLAFALPVPEHVASWASAKLGYALFENCQKCWNLHLVYTDVVLLWLTLHNCVGFSWHWGNMLFKEQAFFFHSPHAINSNKTRILLVFLLCAHRTIASLDCCSGELLAIHTQHQNYPVSFVSWLNCGLPFSPSAQPLEEPGGDR